MAALLLAACTSQTVVDIGAAGTPDAEGGAGGRGDSASPADTGDASADTAGGGDGESEDSASPTPEDCNAYGVVLESWAHLASGSSLDAYDPAYGPWSADNQVPAATLSVNASEPCALTVGGSVEGDVYTGGDPASVVCEEWGVDITGDRRQLDAPVELIPAVLPAGLPGAEGARSVGWGETWTVAEDHVVDGLALAYGSLVVERSAVIVVDGDLAADGAPISVAEGAVLELYVTGNARLGYGVTVDAGGDSSRVRWRMVGGGTLTLDWGSKLQAVVEIVDGTLVNAGGDFMGSVVGGSTSAAWGAAMHVDLSRLCAG